MRMHPQRPHGSSGLPCALRRRCAARNSAAVIMLLIWAFDIRNAPHCLRADVGAHGRAKRSCVPVSDHARERRPFRHDATVHHPRERRRFQLYGRVRELFACNRHVSRRQSRIQHRHFRSGLPTRLVSAGNNRHGVTNQRVVKKGIANHLESESCGDALQ